MASTASQIKPSIVRIQAQAPGGNSIGTGFLVSKEGHVITCWHVVTFHSVDKDGLLQFEYSDRIVVTWNNRDYNAKVIHRQNTDTPYTSDFALLKIEASGTPFLQLGAYKDVEQGDEVCFMGYPRGYDEIFFGAGHVASLRSIGSHFNQMVRLDSIEISIGGTQEGLLCA